MSTLITPADVAHDCPDCLSETRIVHLGDNVHIIEISHDSTCPTYQEMQSSSEPPC